MRTLSSRFGGGSVLLLAVMAACGEEREFGSNAGEAGEPGAAGEGTMPRAGAGGSGASSPAGGEGGVVDDGSGGAGGVVEPPVDCEPEERSCASNGRTPRVCDADGVWQNEAICQFACIDGFCGGECVPGTGRCDSGSGAPQLCSATGEWDNEPVCDSDRTCSAGECLCKAGLTTCDDTCVTLSNDADHCGSCGHSCLGGLCTDSKCEPVELAAGLTQAGRLALSPTHVYWMDYNNGVGNVKRVSKAGGTVETLATNQGTPGGVIVAGDKIYWGAGTSNSKGGVTSPAVHRANLDGTDAEAFAPLTATADYVALSGTTLYWNERGTNVAFFSKALTSTGDKVPAGTHTNNSNMFAVTGNCVYFRTFVSSVYGISYSCGGATPVGRFSSSGQISMAGHDNFDTTMLYFGVEGVGLYRLPLSGGGQATTVISGTDVVGPILDGDQLYYVDGDAGGAPACTTNWGIYRTAKQPGSAKVTIIPPPMDCPGSLATDAEAIYWINYTPGTIMKLAK